jgi:hypothetical protein
MTKGRRLRDGEMILLAANEGSIGVWGRAHAHDS